MEMKDYCCSDAKRDIDLFFSLPVGSPREEHLMRALKHMIGNVEKGCPSAFCRKCWNYYLEVQQKNCEA